MSPTHGPRMETTLASPVPMLKVACTILGHEDAVAWAENALLLLDPVFDGAGDDVAEFFLIGVIMEAAPLAEEEGTFEHGEPAGAGRGRMAQPAEPHDAQLLPPDVILEYELDRPPLLQSTRQPALPS